MTNIQEQWLPIDGRKNYYEVSSFGNVKNVKTGHPMKATPNPGRCRYLEVPLLGRKTRIHRLVAKAFIPNPENKRTVNHKDGNKQNNCVDNLEWATDSENMLHAIDMGFLKIRGEHHPSAKLSKVHVMVIKEAYQAGHRVANIAKYFNVHRNSIYAILSGRRWASIFC